MKHLPTPIAMLAVLAACELPVSPGGPALPETPDLEIMTRADPVGIRVREVISVRGKRILHPHGVTECILKQEVVLAKGEAHTEWVSEYNPATCEFTIKRGDKPGLAAEILTARNYDLALARGGVNALGDAGTARVIRREWKQPLMVGARMGEEHRKGIPENTQFAFPCGRTPDGSGPTGQSHATQVAWFEDPINWDVNRTTQDLAWTWDEVCIRSAEMQFAGWVLTASGWRVGGEYSSLHIIDDESDSRYVKAQGSAYYYNRVFCGGFFGPNTHAKYSQNDIDGLPGGMARFVDEKSVFGGCSWMLSGRVSRMNL